jgi:carbamoylphosphate synthase small subunit
MTTTQHPRMKELFDRYLKVEAARVEVIQDTKDLTQEMRSAGLTKAEILGIKIAARRSFMTAEQIELQTSAEHVADQLAESGTAPLFSAMARKPAASIDLGSVTHHGPSPLSR